MRGFGEITAVQSVLPDWLIHLVIGVTYLGNIPVLLGIAVAVYWYGDRDRGLLVLATILAGFALTFALKAIIGAPRPMVGEQYIQTQTTAFPSGHALGATVTYGILAIKYPEFGPRWVRGMLAGILVVLISSSRIVLGVHYLVDVLVGIGLGLVLLGLVVQIGTIPRILWLGFGISAVGFGGSTILGSPAPVCIGSFCGNYFAALTLGMTTGAVVAHSITTVSFEPWPISIKGMFIGAFAGIIPIFLFLIGELTLPLSLHIPLAGIGMWYVIAAPSLFDRFGTASR